MNSDFFIRCTCNFAIIVKRKTIFNENLFWTFSQRKTQVSIFFKEPSVEVDKRVETHTYTDFLAICGGLLGLFLGISLLSLIEIIYFATVRLFWIIQRPRPENIMSTPDIPLPENHNSDNRAVCYFLFILNEESKLIFMSLFADENTTLALLCDTNFFRGIHCEQQPSWCSVSRTEQKSTLKRKVIVFISDISQDKIHSITCIVFFFFI